ncbi:MarR family winged helix-turn-helix transcriptional regulator [Streptomyces aurantiogriseus]|uniref:MarR family transcriptional regulator n=1 Tax=Streptomyces aurantiogriseus TaxID=66870 RepID=A0A918KYL0_9ACTN|nr:MarR family transcriptional regulator [Streptomyces aurantiogriseus]GGR47326.1 MarR family transcriptional regulator [Streptomyces aurantiogriseus]
MIIDRVSFALAHSGKVVEAAIRQVLAEQGLKLSHAHVLGLLAERERLSQQALIEELQVDPSVLVTLLNALEGDGLVARRRDPSDRRRHVVEISERGMALVAQVDAAVQAAEAELFGSLDDQELAALRRLLDRVKGAKTDACAD